MSNLSENQLEKILFIKCLGDGKANPFLENPKRKRISFTPILILYQMYLLQKNVHRGVWKDIHTMKETIAEYSGVSRTSITNFFNSREVDLFIGIARYSKRENGRFSVNHYWLKPGIFEAMAFLERKGFFKGIKTDLMKWRIYFDKRLESWLIPLLEKGLDFRKILKGEVNILSTKNKAKLAAVEPAKLAGTTLPPEESFTTHRHLNNPVVKPVFFYSEFETLHANLERLHIPEWQRKIFIMHNAPAILAAAAEEAERWTRGDWKPLRMTALLQKRINEHGSRRKL